MAFEPVTTGRILDLITSAVHATLRGNEDGASHVFKHMTLTERLAFDLFLVRMDDDLAHEAGTTERRFKTRVERMAALEQTRRTVLRDVTGKDIGLLS